MAKADIENRFTFHAANDEQVKFYEEYRAKVKKIALWLDKTIPDGREKSLAITHLEEAVFWGNAAVARTPEQ